MLGAIRSCALTYSEKKRKPSSNKCETSERSEFPVVPVLRDRRSVAATAEGSNPKRREACGEVRLSRKVRSGSQEHRVYQVILVSSLKDFFVGFVLRFEAVGAVSAKADAKRSRCPRHSRPGRHVRFWPLPRPRAPRSPRSSENVFAAAAAAEQTFPKLRSEKSQLIAGSRPTG